ncbi:MAG: hypothetical protein ACPG8K_04690, partial [Crocinitomicaceae bacterium]
AYKTAAKQALEEGEVEKKEVFQWFELRFKYHQMTDVMHIVSSNQLEILDPNFEIECKLKIHLPLNSRLSLLEEMKLINVELIDLGIY